MLYGTCACLFFERVCTTMPVVAPRPFVLLALSCRVGVAAVRRRLLLPAGRVHLAPCLVLWGVVMVPSAWPEAVVCAPRPPRLPPGVLGPAGHAALPLGVVVRASTVLVAALSMHVH